MATADDTKNRCTRRTRIVCISDTHNCTIKLPPGDVLIHAGDLTNQGSYSELSKAIQWLARLPHEAKIIIAGNHDITLDTAFYARHGHQFHNKNVESPEECQALIKNCPSLTYLQHETATIRLSSPTGPRTEFTVFGSPLAPAFRNWAFYYPPYNPQSPCDDAETVDGGVEHRASPWDDIPASADIVVTHTPPRGHCDDRGGVDRPSGCEALRRALWRVRPRLAVCGHIHEGRGVSRVSWDLSHEYGERDNGGAAHWQDPGAGADSKISLVNLTARKSGCPLNNDGLWQEDSRRGSSPAGHSEEEDASGENGAEMIAPGWCGRKETCVVNAAILKSRFPHAGGKQFYKPIVVDIDLPVAKES
ncbi:hypothetical protein MY10362_000643 [Beauveria mimosiformis]